jgi:hypothetical protein
MTPKEKAEELVHRYDTMQSVIEGFSLEDAKQCALICVDEILIVIENERVYESIDYWEEVKKEIKLL